MDEEKYYAEALRGAMNGNDSDARELLHGLCSAVEQGTSIPKPILDYLYAAFTSYLSGDQKLDKSLLLVKQKGRPDKSPIRIRGGRIYTDVVIAAILSILVKRGLRRSHAIALMEKHRISPTRTTNRFDAAYNLLGGRDWTTPKLRRLIRDEREVSKRALTEDQRRKIAKGKPKG